jgi:putative redox protein
MTKLSTDITWTSGMAFRASVDGHTIVLDAAENLGGQDQGPRPKPLLLASLGGCTGMDVIAILKKMRITPEYFNIKAEGDVTEEHPKQYTRIHLIYEFRGKELPMEQLKKAVDLSQEKYCGISATLRKAVEITSEIRILE